MAAELLFKVVAFYYGVRMVPYDDRPDDRWEDCAYRLLVDPDDGLGLEGVEVDLPEAYATDVATYRASLGHKEHPTQTF